MLSELGGAYPLRAIRGRKGNRVTWGFNSLRSYFKPGLDVGANPSAAFGGV